MALNDLGGHKRKAIHKAIRAAVAHLFFFPPYSPELNPIEKVCAKLKALLRKAAKRSVEDTRRRICQILDHFSAAECANNFVNAGYAPH